MSQPLPLKTPRLLLRDLSAGDAEPIQAYAGDPLVTRYTSFGPNTPAVCDWAFHQLGLQRLIAHCLPANTASASVLKKLGFWQETTVALPRVNDEVRSYLTFVQERQ